jgi:hypothetical protein
MVIEMEWSTEFPAKKGVYWFYGEISFGTMNGHYDGHFPPKPEMTLVLIRKIANGFFAVAKGRIMETNKFNPEEREAGFLGYWAEAQLPDAPEDIEHYFPK